MKPDWFVLGADRSAKWHGETVDSHHMGGKLQTPGKFPKEHRLQLNYSPATECHSELCNDSDKTGLGNVALLFQINVSDTHKIFYDSPLYIVCLWL